MVRLGWSFAKAVQGQIPSPPWDGVILGMSEDNLAILQLALVRGHVAVVYRIPLEDVQDHERQFLSALPAVVAQLDATYQEQYPAFLAEGNLPDCSST